MQLYDKEKVYIPVSFQPVMKATIQITLEEIQHIVAMDSQDGYASLGMALIEQLMNKTD